MVLAYVALEANHGILFPFSKTWSSHHGKWKQQIEYIWLADVGMNWCHGKKWAEGCLCVNDSHRWCGAIDVF